MTDLTERELTRALDAEPTDYDVRRKLTRERLRAARGLIAYWQGLEPPHPSASRLTLSVTMPNLLNPTEGPFTSRSDGWGLALGGVEDVFEVALAARSCVVLDLATGRWVRMHGRRASADVIQTNVAEQPTTVDAFGRPRPAGTTSKAAVRMLQNGIEKAHVTVELILSRDEYNEIEKARRGTQDTVTGWITRTVKEKIVRLRGCPNGPDCEFCAEARAKRDREKNS